ncbi:Ig-like domain-containing protein, partial [bacterium]|nr:Ig-like domain-containing protein [bacterium]
MRRTLLFLSLFSFIILIFTGCVNPLFDDNSTVEDDIFLSYPNEVKSTTPDSGEGGIVAGSNLYIRFYRPMHKSKTEQAFTIDPAVAGEFSWPERTVLKFDPDPRFKWDQKYTVTINDTAYDTYGNRIGKSHFFTFSTPFENPAVSLVYPAKDAISINVKDNVEITFSEDMDRTSVYNAFSISPSVQGVFNWDDLKLTFDPSIELDNNTVYTVTISTAAKDLVENPLKADYSFSFTTAPRSELVKPTVTYVQSTDNNIIKVYLSEKITQATAENANSFSVDGGLIIKSLHLEEDQRTITLTTSNQIEAKVYTLTIEDLTDLAGNVIDTILISFDGIDPPDLISANPVNSTSIELLFSEPLKIETAQNINNYFLNPFLKITGATLEMSTEAKVLISVDPQTSSQIYTLTVKNIMDKYGIYV